jgi:hypothetical protein
MRHLFLPEVRQLAGERGLDVVPATMSGCWRLVSRETGEPLCAPNGSCAFTLTEARRFLLDMPAPKPARARRRELA